MEIAIDRNGNARRCQASKCHCSLVVLNNRADIAQGKHGSKDHYEISIISKADNSLRDGGHLPCCQKYERWRTIILRAHTSRNQDRIADPLDSFEQDQSTAQWPCPIFKTCI